MPLPFTIYIIEDNDFYRALLSHRLRQNPDYAVLEFASAQACLAYQANPPQLISLDYSLPDGRGDQVLRKLRERLPQVPVVVVSAQEDVGTAIALLQQGAYDYLVKDENTPSRLWDIAQQVYQQLAQQRTTAPDTPALTAPILGSSPGIREVLSLVEKAARTSLTVSITGETGTGKELVARAIHQQSARRQRPFVAVNVAAIPRELLESELFGHEKGAFTGAVSRRIGRFEEAHQGTLFLDEIGELDLNLQAKLLRVLQERELTRVGGNKTIGFDARLIVATHRDLAAEIKAGRFREDLYYRLLGLPIHLPPLRERGADALLLAEAFLESFSQKEGLPVRKLSEDARQKLLQYRFPGNVRELKAVVELAAVLADGDTIQAADLTLRSSLLPEAEPAGHESLREQVARIVQRYLDAYEGNIPHVAGLLKIGKSTIYRMIQNNEVRTR